MASFLHSTRARRAIATFLLTAVVWCAFSWPLPRYLLHGIPCASENMEVGAVRAMIPGDHLQSLYYLWLGGEMIQGRVPPFHDIYQFNTGSDADRFRPSAFLFPFCLLFSLLAKVGGPAFGYNVTGFLSLWLSLWAAWVLARRYCGSEAVAGVAALLGFVLPFRWISLFGGSPTGTAMLWIPCLLLGLDVAIRDARAAGGWLAASSAVLLYCGDVQAAYLTLLALPVWCLICLLQSRVWRSPLSLRAWLALCLAAAPVALGGAITALSGTLRHRHSIGASTASAGRTWDEVALFSPRDWHGFFSWLPAPGPEHHLFVGWVLPGALALAVLVLLIRAFCRPRGVWPAAAVAVLLACAGVLLCLLAMGTYGPNGGRLLLRCRERIPHFTMVRQTTKVLCLLPSLVTVLAAVSLDAIRSAWSASSRSRPLGRAAALLLLLGVGLPPMLRIRATIALLDADHPAYRAVAEDAAALGRQPRCVAVPLWPGDSAWSSLYQYYAARYRIRMLNGYAPFVSREYVRDVFERFQGINQGCLSNDDLAELSRRGVRYVVLHESAFPEKVSPAASGFTLQALLEHPRLDPLASHDGVWAFRIAETDQPRSPTLANCDFFTPTRRWEAEKAIGGRLQIVDGTCSGGAFARLDARSEADAGLHVRGPRTAPLPTLRWAARVRGPGALSAATVVDAVTNRAARIEVAGPDWCWIEIGCGEFDGASRVELQLDAADGRTDVDTVGLVSGLLPRFAPGVPVAIPAAALFHRCATDPSDGSVLLQAPRDQSHPLRGPDIPMPAGTYRVEMVFDTPAPPGVELGFLRVTDGVRSSARFPVVSGEPAVGRFMHRQNLPLEAVFDYLRRADVRVRRLVFTRLP
jgi:hypothetical protein